MIHSLNIMKLYLTVRIIALTESIPELWDGRTAERIVSQILNLF
jgi:hypothetical protein